MKAFWFVALVALGSHAVGFMRGWNKSVRLDERIKRAQNVPGHKPTNERKAR